METAAAVAPPAQTNDQKVESVMQTSSTGINKTNLKQTIHHFDMAQKSLFRAFEYLAGMTEGRNGRIATTLGTGITAGNAASGKIVEAQDIVAGVLAEIEELYA